MGMGKSRKEIMVIAQTQVIVCYIAVSFLSCLFHRILQIIIIFISQWTIQVSFFYIYICYSHSTCLSFLKLVRPQWQNVCMLPNIFQKDSCMMQQSIISIQDSFHAFKIIFSMLCYNNAYVIGFFFTSDLTVIASIF